MISSGKWWALLLLVTGSLPVYAGSTSYQTTGVDAVLWGKVLGSIGLTESTDNPSVRVLDANAQVDVQTLSADHIVIIQGWGSLASALGFKTAGSNVSVRQIRDNHAPQLPIIWEQPVDVEAVAVPSDFQTFASERWMGIPVIAGRRTAHGAILWMATDPGLHGYERYPYLLQALVDLGLDVSMRSTDLWAFFDSAYRLRADPEYLARHWREAGVSVLHVAAWHNMEQDDAGDAYIKSLIEACHRHAILVYAWLELPHVSEKFWANHPEWREKTALGQDAQLDWRKLMNLQNAECRKAVAELIGKVVSRFDWDGVNVAELYFESLEGASNPARLTPMNADIRREFKRIHNFDPALLFDSTSPLFASKNPSGLRKFLDYRAVLAARMQSDWLKEIEDMKASKPYLDVVLTHIDDRFDPGMRDALGADVSRVLPVIEARRETLLVEDPANLWNLGPERYAKLASKYRELTRSADDLAVDINVVERYQDVYPTKKQTGVELFQLVHQAAESFGHVALYFENSLEKQDLPLLSASAATSSMKADAADIVFNGRSQTRVAWEGPLQVDGRPWPVVDAQSALIPAGHHRLSTGTADPAIGVVDFNGDIRSAISTPEGAEVAYLSRSRAIAITSAAISGIDVDGAVFWRKESGKMPDSILLPAGQHLVAFRR